MAVLVSVAVQWQQLATAYEEGLVRSQLHQMERASRGSQGLL